MSVSVVIADHPTHAFSTATNGGDLFWLQADHVGQLAGRGRRLLPIASCSLPFFAQNDPKIRIMSKRNPENGLARFD
jgi:hypothetical protein